MPKREFVAADTCQLRTKKDRKTEFFVCLCFDVFLKVLLSGNRRQLAKLKRIGRRFHIIIDQKLGVKPFLRLNLISWNPLLVYISSQQISSDAVLPEPTAFLRFGVVSVFYRLGQQPIAAKCESIKKLLLPFTSVLEGAKLKFDGRIDSLSDSDFSDHSMLLAHVANDLLSICNRCCSYEFHLSYLSEQSAPAVISSILEMALVRDCNNVKFVLFTKPTTLLPGEIRIDQPTVLPVEAITKWFIPSADGRKEKKALEIRMGNISNGAEIEARLKESKYGNRNKDFCADIAFNFGDLCVDELLEFAFDEHLAHLHY